MKKKQERCKKSLDKLDKVKERDEKGRYVKGHKGGPGRHKGEPRDIICKDGKKRSVEMLITDLLATYKTLGGEKFLKKWAASSNRNLARFIEILFKFAPQPQDADPSGSTSFAISEKYMPIVEVNRIITDVRPGEMGDPLGKRIKYLEDRLKEKDKEISRLRASVNIHDTKEIEHEPIRPTELPEHSKAEKQSKDSTNQKSKQESGKRSNFVTTGDFDCEGKLRSNYLAHREQRKKEDELIDF